jgi:CrcB protein
MISALYPYLLVALGGAIGAMARFALNSWVSMGSDLPWGTLMANLLGCLAMGVLAQVIANTAWLSDAGMLPEHYRLLFAVGFCGSFTTLSALVFEISAMLQRNEVLTSFSYLIGTLVGGFAFFYLGVLIVKSIAQLQAAS